MKILYLANIRLPTQRAHGVQIMETCAAMAAAGHEVTLAVSSWKSDDEDAIFSYYNLPKSFAIVKVAGVGLVSWGRVGFFARSLLFSLNVRRTIDTGLYDAVYTRDESLVRRGFFYEIHDVRRGSFQRHALARAAGIVAITRGLADYCRSAGVGEDRLIVAPGGVDISKFDVPEGKEACRAKLGLPSDGKIVLYLGHLFSWKGASMLTEAASLISGKVSFLFVGGTDSDVSLFNGRFGSDHRIKLVGYQPRSRVPYYMRAADVLVLPNSGREAVSRLYTSPMKIFEYMASGTPIVASDLPSLREILDGSNAVLAAPDDPKDLARNITRLIGDPGLAGKISEKARTDVERYTWSARVSSIIALMKDRRPALKDTAFYNKASDTYSSRRYPEKSTDYNHFFFKRRLDVVIDILEDVVPRMQNPSLLEVGCADGVVLRRVFEKFGMGISSYAGIDIAPRMIEVAHKKHAGTPLRFSIRDPKKCFGGKGGSSWDILIEIGVLNYADFDLEIECVERSLSVAGYYICSVAGNGSLWDRLVRVDKRFENFMSYAEYETKIRRSFDIVRAYPVGLYLPKLWRVPAIARIMQPISESCIRPFLPGLFHEKVYLLKRFSRPSLISVSSHRG